MTWEQGAALLTALAAILGAFALVRQRQNETRESEAKADQAQHDASQSIANASKAAVDLLRGEMEDLRTRLTAQEKRAALAEARIATAEAQAHHFRVDVIELGEKLAKTRAEYEGKLRRMAGIVARLIDQVESLGGKPDIDMPMLKELSNLIQGNNSA